MNESIYMDGVCVFNQYLSYPTCIRGLYSNTQPPACEANALLPIVPPTRPVQNVEKFYIYEYMR